MIKKLTEHANSPVADKKDLQSTSTRDKARVKSFNKALKSVNRKYSKAMKKLSE